jgi:hypothetical protein
MSKLLPRLSLPLAESLQGFAERGIERSLASHEQLGANNID